MILNENDSFVIYRKPFKEKTNIIRGKWKNEIGLSYSSTKSFVFSTFSGEIFKIVGEHSTLKEPVQITNSKSNQLKSTDINCYKNNIQDALNYIDSGIINKIIISRLINHKHTIQNHYNLFNAYCKNYDHGLVYLLNHPTKGLWIGVSPELLLSKGKSTSFSTESLAGSQKWKSDIIWNKKEIEEQDFVSKHIINCINKHGKLLSKSESKTKRAGNLAHINTLFKFSLINEVNDLIEDLHPTPAIAGTPRDVSIKKIKEIERHKRELYCGFLGEISSEEIELYINLRCAKVYKESLNIYVGGGITNKSEIEKEFEETEIKSQTILSVIKNL
jgi:isochorismate synthase